MSSEWAPRFVAAGAVVVDNTSFWRMHSRGAARRSPRSTPTPSSVHSGLIANPNCSTMQLMIALGPIERQVGIERIVISTYQSVSGTGQRAVDELEAQAHAILHGQEPPAPSVYPHRIAFNVLPQVETFKDGDDYTTEERKLMAETRKILALGDEELGISATCARVPVFVGHSQSVNVQTREPLSPEECRELLAAAPGALVVDDPADGVYPLATDVAGRDEVLVGRIRRDPSHGALPEPLGRRRQPAQGRRDQRRPGRRAARRARPPPRPRRRGSAGCLTSVLAAIASAALIVAGSLAVGQAALALCGRRDWTWLAGPVGLALLLVCCGAAAGLGARGTALALVFAALMVAAVIVLVVRRGRPLSAAGLIAAALAALFAAIPFIAAGRSGILGVGLVNDDMASHLLLADWIAERFRPEPVLIDQGYPLGPHALVAGLATTLGASSIDVFAGLVLAIPALTALVAYEALDGLGRAARAIAAALTALPYLAAAYLAQEAFKEPIMALFVLCFALLLPRTRRLARRDPPRHPRRRRHLRLLLPRPRLAGRRGVRLGGVADRRATAIGGWSEGAPQQGREDGA